MDILTIIAKEMIVTVIIACVGTLAFTGGLLQPF
jgi:hypothetical protein